MQRHLSPAADMRLRWPWTAKCQQPTLLSFSPRRPACKDSAASRLTLKLGHSATNGSSWLNPAINPQSLSRAARNREDHVAPLGARGDQSANRVGRKARGRAMKAQPRLNLVCPLGGYICSYRIQKVLLNVPMQGGPPRFSITARQRPIP